jgi:hypothetical protein
MYFGGSFAMSDRRVVAVPIWTAQTVWMRVLDAVEIHRIMPAVEGPEGTGNCWPDIVRSPWEAYSTFGGPVLIETPTEEQAARYQEVMRWLTWTLPSPRKAILHRARGAGDDWIAAKVFRNPKYAHLIEGIINAALARIADRLNVA